MLEHLVPNTATPYIMLKFEVVGAGMAVATDFLDFIKTAQHPTLMIVGVVVVLCLGELLIWVETSRKDIKLWGIEITQPESDGIKSCRAIQAAFHDKTLGLENDRAATYRVIENDGASIDAFTRLQIEARVRDQDPNTHVHDTESAVLWRLNSLVDDSNGREEHVKWLNETEEYYTRRVDQECGSLLIKSQ